MACNVQRKGIRPWRQVQQQQRRRRRQERQQQLYKRIRDAPLRRKHPAIGSGAAKTARGSCGAKGTATTTTNVAISVLLLLLLSQKKAVNAEGNVGCFFVKTLCLVVSEVCFDDNIFGKCIPTTGVDVEDIEKTPLTEDQSRILSTMLEEMQGAGLGWDHPFVQCRIQGALYSLQKQTLLPPNLCANLAPTPEVMDPSSEMAFVRFTPPNENYAEERQQPPYFGPFRKSLGSFVPHRQLRHDPMELAHFGSLEYPHQPAESSASLVAAYLQRERERSQRKQLQRERELQTARDLAAHKQLELYQMLAASEPDPEPFQRHPAMPLADTEMSSAEDERREQESALASRDGEDSNEIYFPENYAVNFKRTSGGSFKQQPLLEYPEERRGSYHRQLEVRPNAGSWKGKGDPLYQPKNSLAQKRFNDKEQSSNELEDDEDDDQDARTLYDKRLLYNSLTPIEEAAILAANTYPAKLKQQKLQDDVYTEGGRIFVPELNQKFDAYEDAQKKEKARLLLENMLGFTRHERLDVKKPGPLIRPPQSDNTDAKASRNNASENSKGEQTKESLPQNTRTNSQTNKEKKVVKVHSEEDHAPHIVDTEYAHVFVRNPIDSWGDGVRIVNELSNILHMQGYFTYLTVQPHEVSFRVDSSNPERKTATDVARIINDSRGVRNNILRRLGVIVTGAGVGDKIKRVEDGGVSSSRVQLAEQPPDLTHIMAYMFAGAGAAAVIVIFVTLTLIKRHDKKRDKLSNMQTSTVAAAETCNKDYQELCRARMAGKVTGGPEPATSGRIMTLSKDSDRPPSSRSSTSSWSEEPALTNMDISTGHMVLSYMEDHLRNKGRLQREWEALCRYEAEPSASEAALQPQCSTLNRVGAPLPYDHSRVLLNHVVNAEGLDYINASSITDHDPRTPAYVAAQGPLPTTLAHFWQMIWEQGAVVIVDLCRLQENGDVACARYWPEDGAEVYHVYEVNLVSEHIWCDDYLVRSFYLKNLRTSDTRTVTQFHFLSWPQGGVPAQPKALLDFRRKVNKSYRGRSCPIVVHSSAGAGRTGAYILLDLVLGRMNKGAREIDIAATLEHLRDQRAGLVATRQQFEFVLMAVAEEVHAILKALPANTSNEKREIEDKKEATLKEEHESSAESEVAGAALASAKAVEK